jgi:hypothetical protein
MSKILENLGSEIGVTLHANGGNRGPNIEGHLHVGDMDFWDFPSQQLHKFADFRNNEILNTAREYAHLTGADYANSEKTEKELSNGIYRTKNRLNDRMNNEFWSGKNSLAPELGRMMRIRDYSFGTCQYSEESYICAYLIPTLQFYLEKYEQKKENTSIYGATTRDYDNWKSFLEPRLSSATAFFYKTLSAYISLEDFKRHAYVIGGTGSGKSELFKLVAHQVILDMKNPNKNISGILIDPHGDFGTEVARFKECKNNDDIILFDPLINNNKTPCINLFYTSDTSNENVDILSSNLVDAFDEIMADTSISAQMRTLLAPCIAVLFRREGSRLEDLQRFMLTDENDDLIELGKNSPNRGQAEFFRSGFHLKKYETTKSSIYTRLQSLLNSSIFSRLVSPHATLDLEHELNNGKFIIMNLSRGGIGKDVSSAFGRLVMAQVKNIGFRRQALPKSARATTFVFIDECQNFIGESIEHTLTELRKYGVHLLLANQVYGQHMTTSLTKIIMSCTNIKFVGENDPESLRPMAKQVKTSVEELQKLTVGKFCAHVKKRGKTTSSFVFKAPTYLLENNHSMTSSDWYDQKVKGWRGYVDNHKLDERAYNTPHMALDNNSDTTPHDGGNGSPKFKF